jgi:hypothetical protein
VALTPLVSGDEILHSLVWLKLSLIFTVFATVLRENRTDSKVKNNTFFIPVTSMDHNLPTDMLIRKFENYHRLISSLIKAGEGDI